MITWAEDKKRRLREEISEIEVCIEILKANPSMGEPGDLELFEQSLIEQREFLKDFEGHYSGSDDD